MGAKVSLTPADSVISPLPEELPEQSGTLFLKHSAQYLGLGMYDGLAISLMGPKSGIAPFFVVGAKYNPANPGVVSSPGAHDTWFECHVKRAFVK